MRLYIFIYLYYILFLYSLLSAQTFYKKTNRKVKVLYCCTLKTRANKNVEYSLNMHNKQQRIKMLCSPNVVHVVSNVRQCF